MCSSVFSWPSKGVDYPKLCLQVFLLRLLMFSHVFKSELIQLFVVLIMSL